MTIARYYGLVLSATQDIDPTNAFRAIGADKYDL